MNGDILTGLAIIAIIVFVIQDIVRCKKGGAHKCLMHRLLD